MTTSMLESPPLDERASWVVAAEGPPRTLEVPIGATTTYLTHGLFRYAGKLPPPLVSYLLSRYSEPGDLVVDPMCGGGTTAIEAVTSGRSALSLDVNPVSRAVTSGVSQTSDPSEILRFAADIIEQASDLDPPEELSGYFSPQAYGLLKHGINAAKTPAQRALVLSIVRPASFANTKKINTVVDPDKTPAPPRKLLSEASRRFADGFDELLSTEPEPSEVKEARASELPIDDGTAGFVLLHPPYLTNTAFSESMHLQLTLLGTDPKVLRKLELAYRGSYFHVPNGLRKYLVGWAKILEEARRIVRPGGHIGVVVGDGRIDRVRIPVGTITVEYGADLGLELVERAVHLLNNQTGWTLSRRMTGQHVLVFRVE